MDLGSPTSILNAMRTLQPAIVVNAAAYTAVDAAELHEQDALAINGIGPGVIAEECKRIGALLIHYSTDYVFDGTKIGPYVETDQTNPLSAYGRTKLAGEQAIADSGCAHAIFRTSWVYGTRGRNFLLTMLRLFSERPELRIVADQIGAPTWARSIAEMTALAVSRGMHNTVDLNWWQSRSGIYHMTAAGETSWAGFAEAIAALAPVKRKPAIVEIATAEYPTPARRPANSRLALTRFQETFNLKAPHWKASLGLCLADKFDTALGQGAADIHA